MHSATTHKANGGPVKIWRGLQFVCSFWLLIILGSHLALGQVSLTNTGETLRISGHYQYVFKNNTPGTTNYFHFVALTASNGWRISAVNDHDTNDWGLLQSDGTNLYLLGSFLSHSKYKAFGYSFPGQFYTPEFQDTAHLFMPWMSFYFTPELTDSPTESATRQILWPWGNALYAHSGYGYKWVLTFFPDSRILQRIDVLRDASLDRATPEDELRRSKANYPFAMSYREGLLQNLEFRESLTNGYDVASFEYKEILHTNSITIPSTTGFIRYWPGRDGASVVQDELSLRVDHIDFLQNTNISQLVTPVMVSVCDYRYQMANDRTKFNCATYTLNAGDSFRSGNDPVLLAQAEDWLKHGQRYESYTKKRGVILAGIIGITLIFIGVILFRLKLADSASHTSSG